MSDIEIEVDDRKMTARQGESLAATLTAHGILTLRETPQSGPRGIFCGMGVCQECLVTVNGVANRRACMTKVTRPLKVQLRDSGVAAAPNPAILIDAIPMREAEVVVVGAGPAGLSAAIAARRAGADVLVLDERSDAGGQYFKQLAVSAAPAPDAQHREGAALVAEAKRLGVALRSNAVVWGAFDPLELAVTVNGGTLRVRPQRLILATGAYERPRMFPGWTLPGVMTTGAAQTLWRTARRLPGKRVLIAGNGPLNLQLAYELLDGGADIRALAEASSGPSPASWRALLGMAAADAQLVAQGVRYRMKLMKQRVPVHNGTEIVSVRQEHNGLIATLADRDGSAREYEADAICTGYGFLPSHELLRALGARFDFDAGKGYLVPRRDADGRTSLAGVYSAGDCTGIGGARVALAEGALVGFAAAESLGKSASPFAAERAAAKRKAIRQRRFQRALWTMYATPAKSTRAIPDDAIVCRCESVTAATLRGAIASGCGDAGEVKRVTRAGMGRCQGRYCGSVITAALSEARGGAPGEYSGFAPRVPVKPLDIATLRPSADTP